jgi:hypothetical protein
LLPCLAIVNQLGLTLLRLCNEQGRRTATISNGLRSGIPGKGVFKRVCASSAACRKKQEANKASKAAYSAKHLSGAPGAATNSAATQALLQHAGDAAVIGLGEAAPVSAVTEVNGDALAVPEVPAPAQEPVASAAPAVEGAPSSGEDRVVLPAAALSAPVFEPASALVAEHELHSEPDMAEQVEGDGECRWEVVAQWHSQPFSEVKVRISRSSLSHTYVGCPCLAALMSEPVVGGWNLLRVLHWYAGDQVPDRR